MKRLLALAVLVFGLVGLCAAVPLAAQDKPSFKERVETYWNAELKQDWPALYDYVRPSEKENMTREQFAAKRAEKAAIRYLSYNLGHVETSNDRGWAKVSYSAQASKFPNSTPRKLETWQLWEKDGDQWYPVPSEEYQDSPKLPPSLRPLDEEEVLTQRAQQFWQARETGDWGFIYETCDPEFRKHMSREEFLGKKAMRTYLSHSVEWTEITGDKGRVKIDFSYRLSDPSLAKLDPVEESIVENWVKVDGKWYRYVPTKSKQRRES